MPSILCPDDAFKSRTWPPGVQTNSPEIDRQSDASSPRPPGSWNRGESKKQTESEWALLVYSSQHLISYLLYHLMQISRWISPWCNRIAEEYKIRHHANWIYGDHVAHTTERWVLFVVVTNVPQWRTPERNAPNEHLKENKNHISGLVGVHVDYNFVFNRKGRCTRSRIYSFMVNNIYRYAQQALTQSRFFSYYYRALSCVLFVNMFSFDLLEEKLIIFTISKRNSTCVYSK